MAAVADAGSWVIRWEEQWLRISWTAQTGALISTNWNSPSTVTCYHSVLSGLDSSVTEHFCLRSASVCAAYGPNSTWLVSSRLDSTRSTFVERVEPVETSESSRAVPTWRRIIVYAVILSTFNPLLRFDCYAWQMTICLSCLKFHFRFFCFRRWLLKVQVGVWHMFVGFWRVDRFLQTGLDFRRVLHRANTVAHGMKLSWRLMTLTRQVTDMTGYIMTRRDSLPKQTTQDWFTNVVCDVTK